MAVASLAHLSAWESSDHEIPPLVTPTGPSALMILFFKARGQAVTSTELKIVFQHLQFPVVSTWVETNLGQLAQCLRTTSISLHLKSPKVTVIYPQCPRGYYVLLLI